MGSSPHSPKHTAAISECRPKSPSPNINRHRRRDHQLRRAVRPRNHHPAFDRGAREIPRDHGGLFAGSFATHEHATVQRSHFGRRVISILSIGLTHCSGAICRIDALGSRCVRATLRTGGGESVAIQVHEGNGMFRLGYEGARKGVDRRARLLRVVIGRVGQRRRLEIFLLAI
mmetsp:Transcript_14003/g.16018  ORF Transcript_14003/g.16018 Transcript_14003/m.16018 type:complete len:173 (-) Transcript_14003:466-984(-)